MPTLAYETILASVIKEMENGNVPWRKPWFSSRPYNMVGKNQYRGINSLWLSIQQYDDPRWLTFNQAKNLGGNIKAGEHGTPVIFWKILEKSETQPDGTDKIVKIPLLRSSTVFNIVQCEKIDAPVLGIEPTPIPIIQQMLQDLGWPATTWGSSHACYNPTSDSIDLPAHSSFVSDESYYATYFHELIHATGHSSRLDRFESIDQFVFSSSSYSQEELVAELGSSFLCAEYAIDQSTIQNSASYLRTWLSRLNDEKMLLMHAAAQAEKAVDLILGKGIEDVTE
jgi:antirestriction protein ArdC